MPGISMNAIGHFIGGDREIAQHAQEHGVRFLPYSDVLDRLQQFINRKDGAYRAFLRVVKGEALMQIACDCHVVDSESSEAKMLYDHWFPRDLDGPEVWWRSQQRERPVEERIRDGLCEALALVFEDPDRPRALQCLLHVSGRSRWPIFAMGSMSQDGASVILMISVPGDVS